MRDKQVKREKVRNIAKRTFKDPVDEIEGLLAHQNYYALKTEDLEFEVAEELLEPE